MPTTHTLWGFANSSVGWTSNQIDASGPATVIASGLEIDVIDDDPVFDDESNGAGQTLDTSSQVLGNSFGDVAAGQVIQSVYSWTVTNTTTGQVGTGYLLRIYNSSDPSNPNAGGQDGQYYQVFTIAVHPGDTLSYGAGNFIGQVDYADLYPVNHAPVVPDSPTITVDEQTAVIVNAALVVSDADLDARNGGAGDYAGATFTISRDVANPQDLFSFTSAGAHFTVVGANLQTIGGQTFGTISQSGGVLTISFNSLDAVATTALVNNVLDHIQYTNTSDSPPASVVLDYALNDGAPGGGQGAVFDGNNIDGGTITVNINPVPETIEVDRGGSQPYFGYISDDAGETFSQTFTATGNTITHLTFPVDLDTSSTATMRVLIADVTGGAIGAILYDSGTISIAPVPGESLGYGGGPFRDIDLDMNVATVPGHQYVILFDGLPDADGNDRIVLGWNSDSTYSGGSAGFWFADPAVGLSFASGTPLSGDYAFTMTFADATVINGTPGDDRGDTALIGTNGDDIINGFGGNDELFGLNGSDTLNGGDGHDALRGAAGNDTLNGGTGDDFLNGGFGDDVINGGDGFDRATFATGAVAGVTVNLNVVGPQNTGQGMDTLTGIEHVSGTAFDDTLTGDGGDNWIWGQGGNDVLTGNGGNDLVQAGAPGNLTADGGSGTDTLSVNDNGAGSPGVTVSLALQGGAQATGIGTYTLSGFENLSGSSGNDTLTGDGNNNVLAGDQGDDTLRGGGGDDTLYGDGQFAADTHGLGGSGPITTIADGGAIDPGFVDGNDTLEGGLGSDELYGGGGSDTASYANNPGHVDVLLQPSIGFADEYDAAGNYLDTDILHDIENVTGSAFDDTITGNAADNVFDGGDGDDFLQGRQGNDTLIGGNGDDLFRAGTGDDLIIGGAGYDRVSHYGPDVTAGVHVDLNLQGAAQDTGQGMDTLIGIEALSGTRFDDTLIGDANNNWLVAADGNDTLIGNGGNDLLEVSDGELGAATGNQVLDGGADNDTVGFAGLIVDPDGVTVSLELQGAAQDTGHGLMTLTGIENLSGSQHDDTLTGDGNANTLSGHAGNDLLVGGGGDDSLYGDGVMTADSRPNGFSGPPTFFSDVTAFDPTLVDGNDTLEGGAGNDTLDGGGGSDTASYEHNGGPVDVFLGNGFGAADEYAADGETILSSDTLVSIENVIGSAFGDSLVGSEGNNSLDGRGGDDFIQGLGGDDTLHGGDGNDTLLGDRGDAFIGLSGDDVLYGEGGNDVLRGGLGNDQLYGGDGNDLMRGNGGVDYFDGGADDGEGFNGIGDRISFFEVRATQGAVADLRTGVISNDGYGNVESMVGIESLGGDTAFADTFYGNDGRNYLFADRGDSAYGFGGDDVFQIASAAAVVDGGTGTDRLLLLSSGGWLTPDSNGDGLAETVGAASEGWFVDLLGGFIFDGYGNFGTVTGIENVDGSDLADDIRGDSNDNVLNGGGGDDLLNGRGGNDLIDGGDGNDFIRGDVGNDTLLGGAGNDNLRGGAGIDSFDGGTNTDEDNQISGYGDRVSFFETTATQGVVADLRTGIISNDGFGNVETMVGIESLGADTAFADTFYGNDGRNVLLGNRGDSLYGFGGNDDFFLSSAAATVDGGAGTDRLQLDTSGGWLMPDSNADGIAETAAAATSGWTVDLTAGTFVDGYGNVGAVTGIENVDGSQLGDTLIGDDNANVINGNDGDDTIEGRGGDDTLDGGSGTDTVSYAGSTGPVEVYLNSEAYQYDPNFNLVGHDTLANFENVTGSAFDDFLMGDGNANVINGLDGNDDIVGGGGDDTLIGGAGEDIADYSVASGSVTVDLTTGTASGADGNDTLSGIEDVFGSGFNDHLIGDAGSNQLSGFGGADVIEGMGGADTLRGQGGNDTLLGGDGNDFLNGGVGDDIIDGGAGFDRAAYFSGATAGVTVNLNLQGVAQNTGQGMDTLTNIENVSGTAYGDTLIGDSNNNWLWGSPSTDGVNPPTGSNNDTLDGGGGNDLLTVGAGNHSLTGGTGVDTVSFTENSLTPDPSITVSLELQGSAQATGAGSWTLNGIENLSGGTGNDTLTGDGGDNVLAGNTGNDHLVGGAGSDTLYGDGAIQIDYGGGPGTSGPIATVADVTSVDPSLVDGNDTLEGGLGSDQLYGGGGNDTASYEHNGGAVVAQLNTSTAFADEYDAAGNYLDTDILHDIENLTGSAYNDSLVGNGGDNILSGLDGHDLLRGGGGNDTLLGGNGDDFLNGGFGNDYIDGGAGNDRATFATGAVAGVTVDLNLQGVAQNTGQGMDTLIGIENVSGTAFDDTLTGDGGDNWIWGQGGNDVLTGNGGNDLIQMGAVGNLTASGGSGTDTLSVNNIDASGANVTVSLALQGVAQATGIGTYTLTGFENLTGSAGNDTLTGDGGNNVLAGDQGNDTLVGGAGNDTLYGDGQIGPDTHGTGLSGPTIITADVAALGGVDGNDTLEGGVGNDTLNGGGGSDTASYAHAAGGVAVDLGAGTATGADGNDTLLNIENVTGGAFDDNIFGDGGGNILDGGDGSDFVAGGGGNDSVSGGNGNDILKGQLGDDVIDGGAGIDRAGYYHADATLGGVTVSLMLQGVAQNVGSLGWDTLTNIENVFGTPFADILTGDDGNNWLSGSEATISPGNVSATNNDVLDGRGGNDLLTVGIGNHTVAGGTGNDTLWFSENGFAETGITVSLALQGAAQATGNGSWTLSGIENLTGGVANDTLTGDGNANVLGGGAGSDTLIGGAGNDTLYGDGGIAIDGHDVITTFTDVAGIVPGGIGSDVAMMPGVDGNDTLEGGLGNDTLNGGGGSDTAIYAHASGSVTVNLTNGSASGADGNDTLISIENVTGSLFADSLTGDANANVLTGNDGNDTLDGRAGNDTLNGGNGTDTASYANATGSVTVNLTSGASSGADGNDTLSSIENVTGSAFADTLTGDSGVNVLNGGDGNDTLNGRAGNDTLNGGNGTDTASYANATGAVSVNLNTNSATGADGSDTLSSIENVTGSQFNDTLRGDDNDNVLRGGAGADTMLGGKGDDSLYGGLGNDVMTGQQGADRFVIEANSGTDTIADFVRGTDVVVFDASSGITSFSQLTITKVGSDALVSWAGGNSVLLQGVKASQLTASDFQFGSASFAAAELKSGTNGALLGAIAASGLAELSAAAPAYSSTQVEGTTAATGLHDQAFAPTSLDGLMSPIGGVSLAPIDHMFEASRIAPTEFSSRSIGPSATTFGGNLGEGAGIQPTELLHATAPVVPTAAGGGFGLAAPAVAVPSAAQLAGFVHAAADAPQTNAVVGRVLADALDIGGSHGANVEALINSLPTHDGAGTGLELLAGVAATNSAAMHFAMSPAVGIFGSEQVMVHHDAAPTHA